MDPNVNSLADELVDAFLDYEPLEGALLGLPSRRRALGDLSQASLDASAEAFRTLARRAGELASSPAAADFDERSAVTLDHVRHSASNLAARLAVPTRRFTVSDRWGSAFADALATFALPTLDTDERRREHLERLSALPAQLAQATEQLRAGVGEGLTPVARAVRGALDQIETASADAEWGGLRRDLGDEALGARQDALLAEAVGPAVASHRDALATEVLGAGRDDEHPGLCWLPDGRDMYQRAIGYSTSTARTAEDLHALGLGLFDELDREFSEVGSRLWGTSDAAEVRRRLREDPGLRFDTGEEIVAVAVATVRRAEGAAPEWFGEVPSVACAVEPVPDALAAGSAPAYYFTGALDGSRPGTYFVNTHLPSERFRHLAEAVAFHEAVPGHHFQLTIAQDLGDHLVHQLFGDVTTAEGWGLYAERLADEMGLYSGDLARLGLISTDAWRAARLVVDTGIHALGWSRDRAREWMSAHVPMSDAEVDSEVDRYIVVPGQALAYMVGRLELERLRRLAADELGAAFSVRDFHDAVLRTGPVAPPALAAAVGRWIARTRR